MPPKPEATAVLPTRVGVESPSMADASTESAPVELDPRVLEGGVAGILNAPAEQTVAGESPVGQGASEGTGREGTPASGEPRGGAGSGLGRTQTGDGVRRGPLTHDEVLAQLDVYASDVRARERADRALYSKVLRDYGSQLEAQWEVTPEQVRRWPLNPTIQGAVAANHGLQDFVPANAPVLDISTPCTYARYSVALVQIVVDRKGSLLSKQIVRSSGSRRLDHDVLSLVARSAPFPRPDEMDLSREGLSRSVWDIGVRDYTQSNCRIPGMKPIVKDILLMAVY